MVWLKQKHAINCGKVEARGRVCGEWGWAQGETTNPGKWWQCIDCSRKKRGKHVVDDSDDCSRKKRGKHVVDDSDSDDDLPLGQLSKEKKPKAKPTAPKKVSLVGSLHAHEALATSDL